MAEIRRPYERLIRIININRHKYIALDRTEFLMHAPHIRCPHASVRALGEEI